jgi:SAM-dependent methyltransferase
MSATSPTKAPDERLRRLEQRYRQELEPWSFSERAAESLRHEWIARLAARLGSRRVLDVGCSLGQLTARLAGLAVELIATDLSPTAVERARRAIYSSATPSRATLSFFAGSALSLPLEAESVDLVIASDGLHSWSLEYDERATAIRELRRIVAANGYVLFTEHLRKNRFTSFVDEIRAGGLRIADVSYLYDRPWYQFESWLRAVQHWPSAKALRRNLTIARALRGVGRRIGPSASRHICVLATRDASD